MDNNKNENNRSRRSFFTGLMNLSKEKVKMLTADGKLVEVDKAVFDAANKQIVNNKEILEWMNNPSKNENEI
jgi:peroxiredoxin family protein